MCHILWNQITYYVCSQNSNINVTKINRCCCSVCFDANANSSNNNKIFFVWTFYLFIFIGIKHNICCSHRSITCYKEQNLFLFFVSCLFHIFIYTILMTFSLSVFFCNKVYDDKRENHWRELYFKGIEAVTSGSMLKAKVLSFNFTLHTTCYSFIENPQRNL